MSALVLTVMSTITCQHGGMATLTTANTSVQVNGAKALLVTDIHTVTGCPFTVGNKYQPCVRIEWSQGSEHVAAGGNATLVMTSVGKCYSAENAVQGTAQKSPGQSAVTA
jgi:hypothetical protein